MAKIDLTVKEYMWEKFSANEKNVKLALDSLMIRLESMDKVIEMDKQALNRRLDGMNEFRAALKDQQAEFVRRPEHGAVVEDIKVLMESKARLEGKAEQSSVIWAIGIGIVGVFISALSIVLHFVH